LFRLEAQLAEQVARQKGGADEGVGGRVQSATKLAPLENVTYTMILGAEPVPHPSTYFTLIAPPGKLGILLSNAESNTGPTVARYTAAPTMGA